mmetsp:Transcript_68967/g.150755  ORF Transcript_68967/g.150755 Transcript_68967/m.150755 type:complete len:124 (-) Transcript_68967:1241-1612(-)
MVASALQAIQHIAQRSSNRCHHHDEADKPARLRTTSTMTAFAFAAGGNGGPATIPGGKFPASKSIDSSSGGSGLPLNPLPPDPTAEAVGAPPADGLAVNRLAGNGRSSRNLSTQVMCERHIGH